MQTRVKNEAEIKAMRESGAMLKAVLDQIESVIAPGMTGEDVDQLARRELKGLGGKAAFYGYGTPGFPGAICVSINDEIVHGTPRPIEFEEGDVVGLDFGVKYRGMITDSARTLPVGEISKQLQGLLQTTEQSMYAGIDVLKDGVTVNEIASAVEAVLQPKNYGIIRDLVGHGVGHELHEEPNIPNIAAANQHQVLRAGMTICIEPMATLGGYALAIDDDKWTIRTKDGSIAAHFEHTILITEQGSEVLT